MYAFKYHKPSDLAQAIALLEGAQDGKLIAGGQTLLPTMKQRLAQPSDLVDLKSLGGLSGIEAIANGVEIGAMARHADVASSAVVQRVIPALADLASMIGDPQVRNRGTLGGSVANSDPAADYPAGVLALGATLTTNKRAIAADDFFTGLFETALEECEVLLKVGFPAPARAAYMKFPNPASRYAIVGVFVAQFDDGVRVAVTGAGACAFRVPEMEAALSARFEPDAISEVLIDDSELNEDIHASADYRAHLVTVMARRAVMKALGRPIV